MLTRTWESTHVSMRGARLPDNAKFLMASRRSEMLVRLGLGLGHGLTVECSQDPRNSLFRWWAFGFLISTLLTYLSKGIVQGP
jgi:hypothetical protein